MNKRLFGRVATATAPAPNTRNLAGGVAYSRSAEDALTQYAVTGSFNGTYYMTDKQELDTLKKLAEKVSSEYIAKLAVYSRKNAFRKDTPAALLVILTARKEYSLLAKVFNAVVDNGKMLRNYVGFIRSGQFGVTHLGNLPKRLVRGWLHHRSDEALFRDSVGNSPSIADVIKLAHPRPADLTRDSLYGYILGKLDMEEYFSALPAIIQQYEFWKAAPEAYEVPNVEFRLLTGVEGLPEATWKQIAKDAPWHATRMNLNTFHRHGVFNDPAMVKLVAAKLVDKAAIKRSKVYPQQILMAANHVEAGVPVEIKRALNKAADIAMDNVPDFGGLRVGVIVDVSGSMGHGEVTGSPLSQAAALAAGMVYKNKDARLIAVDTAVHHPAYDPDGSVIGIAKVLSQYRGGGTDLGAGLRYFHGQPVDVVVIFSDNESWYRDTPSYASYGSYYNTRSNYVEAWKTIRAKNPKAKLICVDLTPSRTTMAPDSRALGVINIGGFSDAIFDVATAWGTGMVDSMVDVVNGIALEAL